MRRVATQYASHMSQLNEVFGERDPQIDDAVLLVLVIENGSLSI